MAHGTPDWWKRAEALISVDFIQLNDTPGSYAGQAGKGVKVTAAVDGLEFSDTKIDDHSARHENGGADEISLTGMTPGLHAARHENGGADEMEIDAAAAIGSLRTLGNGAQQAVPGNRIDTKIGYFTKDTDDGAGNQNITGIGFKPNNLEIMMNGSNTPVASIGFDDSVNHHDIYNNHLESANTWNHSTTRSISAAFGGGNYYRGYITAMLADGFTITWVTWGGGGHNLRIFYKASRV